MPVDVPIVWVGDAAPTEQERAQARSWASARALSLTALAADSPAERYDEGAVGRVEDAIRRAREAVSEGSVEAAEVQLARAEAELRAHASLPQSPWLGAEIARTWAHRFSRLEPRAIDRARLAWSYAATLDGGRMPALGEADKTVADATASPVPFTLHLTGGVPRDAVVLLDGVAVEPGELRRPEGEHHVRVLADGELVFAAWVGLGSGSRIDVPLDALDPCRPRALARARWDGVGAVAAADISCGRWVAAARDRGGRVHFADCRASACVVTPLDVRTPQKTERWAAAERASIPYRVPTWVTWAVVGAGVVAAGSLVLVGSGALESRPIETHFVHDGIRTQ